jgi:Chaperone of endosialidase
VRANEKLTAFLELEAAIRARSEAIVLDEQVRFFQHSASVNRSELGGGLSLLGSSPPLDLNRKITTARDRKEISVNPLIRQKTVTSVFLVTLACFALSPIVQAVVPAPDGGYPNNNTAEGDVALLNLTTGARNTAVGLGALMKDVVGSDNTAVGTAALINNIVSGNTATGSFALFHNTTGPRNTASGFVALEQNDIGADNTAVGFEALFSGTGINNAGNTAIGSRAMVSNTAGSNGTAVGFEALGSNTSGSGNTAVGNQTLLANTEGFSNTAIGSTALQNSTGSNNVALGTNAGSDISTASDVICIGANFAGANVNNSCYIKNISGADAAGGDAVFITSAGKLGTVNPPSSARFKEEIKPMNTASEVLFALKPVTFRYKKEFDPKRMPQFGLVAEDVERVNSNLVKRGRDGELQTVRYDAVNAMLLNEFLKEHQKVQKLEAALAAVNERLKEQDAKIDKVNAKVELTNLAPQVANKGQ